MLWEFFWAGAAAVAFTVACVVGWLYLQLEVAHGRLRLAVANLYMSTYWIPARNPNAAAELWTDVRMAAGLSPGLSPPATTAIVGTQLEWPAGVIVRADLGGDLVGVITPSALVSDDACVLCIVRKGQPLIRVGCVNQGAAQEIYLQHLASLALNPDLQQKSDNA